MIGAAGIYTFVGMSVFIIAVLYYCAKKFGDE